MQKCQVISKLRLVSFLYSKRPTLTQLGDNHTTLTVNQFHVGDCAKVYYLPQHSSQDYRDVMTTSSGGETSRGSPLCLLPKDSEPRWNIICPFGTYLLPGSLLLLLFITNISSDNVQLKTVYEILVVSHSCTVSVCVFDFFSHDICKYFQLQGFQTNIILVVYNVQPNYWNE